MNMDTYVVEAVDVRKRGTCNRQSCSELKNMHEALLSRVTQKDLEQV